MANIAAMTSRASYKSLSDKELADMYRSSANQELLAVLYSRYSDLLFGVCMKYLKDADGAADACNDIYVELVSKLLKHEVQQVKAWLHTLARNHCLMKLRSDKKMPTDEFPEHFVQSDESWHPDIAEEREKRLSALEECIEKLKSEQKQAVSLFYIEQKSYNEIAELTGIPWGNIRSYIQNGRRNLKICIEENERAAS
ncbi:MAG: sigma-70 family RNA polymerase sigma factor [Chitinophagaceae bacterium]|nr:sigma-70 family RNA polymerase sigma factor [Chitinophagaceae bacterium]MCU0404796.1 sigma-70 family RNA polymerase sigma factor [Chitinophagaceae bacterium]